MWGKIFYSFRPRQSRGKGDKKKLLQVFALSHLYSTSRGYRRSPKTIVGQLRGERFAAIGDTQLLLHATSAIFVLVRLIFHQVLYMFLHCLFG